MPAKKKKAAATTTTTTDVNRDDLDAATGSPRTAGAEQQIAVDDGSGPQPHEINDNLSSDRMKALLEDHRRMGSRP